MRGDSPDAPVFLVGCQRSGTTALAMHLQQHPDLAMTVNGKLLYLLIVWLLDQGVHCTCGHVRLDEVAFAFARKAPYNLSPQRIQDVQAYLAVGAQRHVVDGLDMHGAIRAILADVYAIVRAGARRIGDKYNEYLLQLPAIHSIYPDAKYIFVFRDPVDVAESMLRHFHDRPWAPADAVRALDKWASWNARWLAMRGTIGPARYIELRYEALVAEPAQTCEKLFDFLGLATDGKLVAQARHVFVHDHVGKGERLHAVPAGPARQTFLAALARCEKVHNLLMAPMAGAWPDDARIPMDSSIWRTSCQH